tara:strand:- start:414 stop:1229 length:816 start_codon:yes stop_codon:yes gene_type:complete
MARQLSDSTASTYKRLILSLGHIDLDDRDLVNEFLSKQTANMERMYLMAIINKLKVNGDMELLVYYQELGQKASLLDTLIRTKRSATKEERENYMAWSDILSLVDVRRGLKNKDVHSHMIYVLLSLYTLLPPQRGQVYYNCYIDKDVDNSNMIDTIQKKLIIKQHKTMRTYGSISLDIPDELNTILLEWTPNCIDNRLLSTVRGKEVSGTSFTNLMYIIFGKKISTDMIRKIYVTEKLKSIRSLAEREKLANDMGHSVVMQEFMYNKSDIE